MEQLGHQYRYLRIIALAAMITAFTATTLADSPDAPSAVKQKQDQPGVGAFSSANNQHRLIATTQKKPDGKYSIRTWPFALAVGAMAAGTVADVETTVAALERCKNGTEMNSWIYGTRPTRGRMYAINVPIMAALTWLSARTKRDRKAGDFHAMWPIPFYTAASVHAVAAAHNATVRC